MPQASDVTPRVPFLRRLSNFLKDLDEVAHYDPFDALEQRVSRLEKEIASYPVGRCVERTGEGND